MLHNSGNFVVVCPLWRKRELGAPENGNRNLSMACFELRAFHGYIRDMVKHPASKYGVQQMWGIRSLVLCPNLSKSQFTQG